MHDAIARFRYAVQAAVGHAPDHIEPGRLHRFATNGRRSDTSGWCRLFDDLRLGVFGDFRASLYGTWTAVDRRHMTPAERAEAHRRVAQARAAREAEQRQQWLGAAVRMRSTWAACVPVTEHDPVHRYLCARLALDAVDVPPCVRFHPAMPYIHDGDMIGTWPAMVAPIVGADGQPRALHRTYLTPDGRKADVPGPVKKLTPACGPLSGASIPLHEPRAGLLGVAEGIETALAAFHGSAVPTVAAYSAGGLAGFLWPAGLQRLVIFADHDDAGLRAAAGLRARAAKAGLQVEVMAPADDGQDWCDVWASRSAVAIGYAA